MFGQGAMRVNGFFETCGGHVLLRYCGSVHNKQTQRSTGRQLAAGSSGRRGGGGRFAVLAPLVSQVNNAPIAPPPVGLASKNTAEVVAGATGFNFHHFSGHGELFPWSGSYGGKPVNPRKLWLHNFRV